MINTHTDISFKNNIYVHLQYATTNEQVSRFDVLCMVSVVDNLPMSSELLHWHWVHYSDVIMGTMASQITSLTIVYSTVLSDADQRKHQSSASLAFVLGIHRSPVNSPHKWPVKRKKFPFDDDVIMSVVCDCPRAIEVTLKNTGKYIRRIH